jgi:hypothetical protein
LGEPEYDEYDEEDEESLEPAPEIPEVALEAGSKVEATDLFGSDSEEFDPADFESVRARLASLPLDSKSRLHDPRSAAFLARAEERLIEGNDPGALYWLSRLSPSEGAPRCPAWLSELVYLGLTLSLRYTAATARRLTELVAEAFYNLESLEEDQKVILAAAVIRPSTILVNKDLSDLVSQLGDDLSHHPPLRELLGALSDLFKNGRPLLGPHTMSRTAQLNMRASRLKELERRTADWRKDGYRKRSLFSRATDLWRALATERGEVYELVLAASEGGDEETLESLGKEVAVWRDDQGAKDRLQIAQKNSSSSVTIDFRAEEQLVRYAFEAMDLAQDWLNHHREAIGSAASKDDHFLKALDRLARMAAKVLSHLEVQNLKESGFLIPVLDDLSERFEALLERRAEDLDLGARLTEAEARRHVWLGRISGFPDPGPEADITLGAAALFRGIDDARTPAERVVEQVDGSRFHLAALELALDPALADVRDDADSQRKGAPEATLKTMLETSSKRFLPRLKDDLAAMDSKIEGARVWGGLADDRRDRLRQESRGLSKRLSELSKLVAAEFSKPQVAYELAELVRGLSRIEAAVQDHLGVAKEIILERLSKSRAQIPEGAAALVESLVADGELLSADEQLNLVEESLSLGEPIAVPAALVGTTETSRFYGALEEIHKAKDSLSALAQLGWTPDREGLAIIEALEGLSPKPTGDLSMLPSILAWLGFTGETAKRFAPMLARPPQFWTEFRLEGIRIESPLPKWGSEALAFRLLLGEGRIDAQNVVDVVSSLGGERGMPAGEPVIVLTPARLNQLSRSKLGRLSRERGLCPVVLDANLIAYLAARNLAPGPRARAALTVGAAGGAHNPYIAEASKPVPPELLFGGREIMERLWDPGGPCLVHGGHQMGKSALLEALARSRHDPAKGVIARRLSPRGAVSLNDLILSVLSDEGLLEGWQRSAAQTPDYVKGLFQAGAKKRLERLLIMIDDCDELLEREKNNNFALLKVYAELMRTTGRKFKLILCGLSAVEALPRHPDYPLKGFGPPIRVGPMPLNDAHDLVVAPMEAAGVAFERGTLVHRVLAMTNHHAGLIQLLCHALVEHVQTKGWWRDLPPIRISSEVIDDVYHKPEVRKRLLERFDWAVDVDPRHRALVFAISALSLEGREPGNGSAEPLGGFPAPDGDLTGEGGDPAELEEIELDEDGLDGEGLGESGERSSQDHPAPRILAKAREIWPAAFDQLETEGLEILLAEGRGLGLLRAAGDKHALRNPNVLALMGGEEALSKNVASLRHRPFDTRPGPEGLRRVLPGGSIPVPSPLLMSQEGDLLGWGSGLTLVVGSKAHGLDKVRDALRRLGEEAESGTPIKVISLKPMGPAKRFEELQRIHDEEAKRRRKSGRQQVIVVVDSLTGVEDGPDVDEAALQEATNNFWRLMASTAAWLHKTGADARLSFKVVALTHPDAWLQKVLEGGPRHDEVEVRHLERWNRNGLDRYLREAGLPGDEAGRLLIQTGGWYRLMWRELERRLDPSMKKPPVNGEFRPLAGPLAPDPVTRACLSILVRDGLNGTPATLSRLEDEAARELKSLQIPFQRPKIKALLEALARLSLITPATGTGTGTTGGQGLWRLDQRYLESLSNQEDKRP